MPTIAATETLARGFERVVVRAESPRVGLSSAIPVPPGHVRAAHRELIALAQDLRGLPEPNPRGVAMARDLLTDVTGPLFTGTDEALVDHVRLIREALR